MKKIYIYAASVVFALAALEVQAQDRKQPVAGPAPVVHVGQPTSFVLKNGMKVMVVQNTKLPRVSYTLSIDNPLIYDGEKAGVASILSEMLGNETKKMNKDQFLEEIDFLGARINFHTGGASANGLSKHNETILNLLADGVINSVLTQEEFDKAKAKAIEGVKAGENSVTNIARRVEDAVLYGKNTPVGEFETEKTLSNVTFADVQAYFKKYYSPENAYLVVVGDIDYKKTEKSIKGLFEAWNKSNTQYKDVVYKGNVGATEINFVDMPNAVQSEIALVNEVELKMTDKDYFAVILANQILGGGGEGRLFLNLREAHGWTYGAYSSISPSRKYPGKFRATAAVRNVVTDSAVTEFIKEIDLIRTTPVKEDELKLAKAKYVGDFVMEIQKPATVARYALNKELYKLPVDFYENYIKNINAVTIADVQKAAQKYFLKDNMRIVIVGKGSDVLSGLEKLGYPIKYYTKEADEASKPGFSKAVPAGVTVNSVVDKYLNAIGGEKKVAEIKSVAITSTAEVQGMKLESISKMKEGYILVEQKMMGNTLSKQVVTPKAGYVMQQGQKLELTGDKLAEVQSEATIFPELKMKANKSAIVTGVESFNGKDAVGVKVGKSVYYYDLTTGLKVGAVMTQEQGGQVMNMTTKYEDYKEVKGVKIPFKQVLNVGIEIVNIVTDVKINEGVTDEDFK
ncbi:insulinase family protein [Myroides odoratimimus]|uniref:Peptidase M16 n=1 Tax=Myroides odoratimimus TaxID=76832 RepID=A0AAI8C514_9FLAO|nr:MULTISPECIES: pitrilysin family protein [Myroides]ALU26092.1 peptidase M16 [Myroides odoratimimus]APA92131.1 peptidase M16 [Myroides sp. ZB35]MCS7471831.1 insulinase family protein [Myroides odoratimimus]MDM1032959.1 insulinase family protein [Myroides odoratimimus]MDM1037263.1 insulinase family protein [Myroides odoratimimus]